MAERKISFLFFPAQLLPAYKQNGSSNAIIGGHGFWDKGGVYTLGVYEMGIFSPWGEWVCTGV